MASKDDDKWIRSVDELISALGRPYLRRVLRVSNSTLSTWLRNAVIPADRYEDICFLCSRHRLPPPSRSLFSFKKLAFTPAEEPIHG